MSNQEQLKAEAEQYIPEGYDADLYKIRHSAAHVMAQAVIERFPEAKIAIGPPIEEGFYYDFELPRAPTDEDIEWVENRMKEIVREKYPFEVREISIDEARELFADQPYKLELIEGLAEGQYDEYGNELPEGQRPNITVYQHDGFVDLCRGPHVEHTGKIKANAVKLMNVAGAYWRGDENNPMLTRIYGTAWHNRIELEQYLKRIEEARKRDHRRLGVQLDLFSTEPEALGGGLILWHPKGGLIRTMIEDFARQRHLDGGYDIVYTPHIGRSRLWEQSGHLDFYRENMYSPIEIEGQEYYLKPMNCPFHIMIYKSTLRSYRALPMRLAEWGTVYRFERSGVLHGLTRVRGFTQDDAHIFCTPEQVEEEIKRTLDFSLDLLGEFSFETFAIYVSTRPEKYVGDIAQWEKATEALKRAVESRGLDYEVQEGEGAFYGPKIDIDIEDALGRAWQCTTIQFDFNLPERFDLTYVGEDGEEHRPYMVHRALLGSMERFFGVLVEHYGGAFPAWLAPTQVVMIPITDRHVAYARKVAGQLREAGFRVAVDDSSDRMGAKIREAQLQKIPYMLIVGDREVENETVSVRLRTEEDLGAMSVDAFVTTLRAVVDRRTSELT